MRCVILLGGRTGALIVDENLSYSWHVGASLRVVHELLSDSALGRIGIHGLKGARFDVGAVAADWKRRRQVRSKVKEIAMLSNAPIEAKRGVYQASTPASGFSARDLGIRVEESCSARASTACPSTR